MSPATISGHDLLPPRRLVRNDTANEQRAVDSALTYMHDISVKMRKLSVADVAPRNRKLEHCWKITSTMEKIRYVPIRLPAQILHMLVLQVLNSTVNIMLKTFIEGLWLGPWISSRAYVLSTNQVIRTGRCSMETSRTKKAKASVKSLNIFQILNFNRSWLLQ